MNSQYARSYRGMQVHAVPEAEKAYDAAGRKLPWAYATSSHAGAEAENDRGREAIEKGPFGRSMRRARGGTSRSRSKTAEPKREEERLRAEQLAAEDAVFGSLRRMVKDDGRRDVNDESEGNAQPAAANAAAKSLAESEREPTEVLIYGFGEDLQWAAIDFYERVSDGVVLEDYDRTPPGQRNNDISRSYGRATAQKSLSKAALRKKNRYAGGNNWIKITFDSQQATELACARSPHIIKGHLVYAEPYSGRGPARDEPIFASQAGAQVTGGFPPSFATTQGNIESSPNATSTLTSATAVGRTRSSGTSVTMSEDGGRGAATAVSTSASTARQGGELRQMRHSRIEGAVPVTFLPADQALMPRAPKQSWFAWFGARELIGTTVPKKDDGSLDWAKASFYWKLVWLLDTALGTDLCGLKSE